MQTQEMGSCGLPVNLTEKRRIISSVAGAALVALGIFGWNKSSFRRAIRMSLGSLLILRGVSGYCPVTARRIERQQRESDQLDEKLRDEDLASTQQYDAD